MIRRTALAVLAALLALPPAAWGEAQHRSQVSVSAPVVRLSDVFSGAGAAADTVIADAPVPGRRIVMDIYALSSLARRHGLVWRPQSKFAQTVVSRESRSVQADEIEIALKRALGGSGLTDNHGIELANRALTVHVAPNLPEPYRVENPTYDPRTGRVSAVLSVAVEHDRFVRHQIAGQVFEMIDVPVLNRRVRRNDVIENADVILKKLRRDAVGRNVIVDRSELVGKAARRYLADAKPLLTDDVEPPKLVRKGNLVTIYFASKNMTLTAKARAAEDGALNETVRVVNVRSNKSIEAVVRSATTVIIPTEKALAN